MWPIKKLMTEHNDNPDPRVEQLLRNWGNQEATGNAEIGRPPAFQPPRVGKERLFHWLPLAAAAVLLAVSLVVLALTLRDDAKMADQQEEIAALQINLREMEKLKAELVEKLDKEELARQEAVIRAEKAEKDANNLNKRLASGENENTELAAEIEVARTELDKKQKEIDSLTIALKKLEKDKTELETMAARASTDKDALAAEKTQLDEEIKRLRDLHLTATEKLTDANKELTRLRSQRALVLMDIRRLYLDMVAQGDTAVSGLQKAVRLRRMTEQCEQLKHSLQSDSARELFDRLEVALIRLEMLDVTSNDAASDELARIVRGGQIIQRIDKVIEQGTEPADVRAFLFEARLILMGDNNVS